MKRGEVGTILGSLGNSVMSAITQYQMMEYMKKKPEDQNKEIIPESQRMAKALADVNEVNKKMKEQANPGMEEEVVVDETMERSNQPLWLRDIWRGGYGSTNNR